MSGQNCTKCGRTAEDMDAALTACNQIECPIRAGRRASLRQLAFFVAGGIGMLGLSMVGLFMVLQSPETVTADAATAAPASNAAAPSRHSIASAAGFPIREPRRDPGRERVLREREARRIQFSRLDPSLFRPSFDCTDARAASLRLICNDPELAIIDRNTNLMFAEALAHSRDRTDLRKRRDAWRRERIGLPDDRNVVLDYYEDWANELGKALGGTA